MQLELSKEELQLIAALMNEGIKASIKPEVFATLTKITDAAHADEPKEN